jgi:hypothetical protein
MSNSAALMTEELAEAVGFDFDTDRRIAALAAFADIGKEIAKLRSLDLTDVHPAVVFSPLVGDDYD